MFLQKVLMRKNFLQKQISSLKQQLAEYPEGHLICTRNGKYLKNIHVLDGTKHHIPKKDIDFARKLAEKKYFSALLEDLIHEEKAVDSFLKHYSSYTPKAEQLINNPSYQKLIFSSIKPTSQELAEWASAKFEANPSHPENLRHPCSSGHIVRSKSEVLIDQTLFTHQLPFRYESPLKLNDLVLYPDFTIRHPETGDFIYWEHFGLMDNSSYSQKAFQKLQIYCANGYVPSINLITTFETKDHPLNLETIENIIHNFF